MKFLVIFICFAVGNLFTTAQLTYPATKKVNQVDTFFGAEVKDPYR